MAVAAPARAAPARNSARKTAAAASPAPLVRGRATGSRSALPFGLGALQPKMALGPPQDSHERQADAAAAHVVNNRAGLPSLTALPLLPALGGLAQRACAACGTSDEDSKPMRIQRKCACGSGPSEPCTCHDHQEEHPEMQIDRAAKKRPQTSGDPLAPVAAVISSPGKPLPAPVRSDMEQGFGRSFAGVRIHDTPRAAASAEGIGAHAYTVGNHIAFNKGQYQPGTDSGRFLLAHELAHTVQQSGAPRPAGTPAKSPRVSQPGDAHEAQANRAANASVTGAPMTPLSAGAAPISRYGVGDFLSDAGDAILDAPGDAVDLVSDVASGAADALGAIWDTAVEIARAVDGHVSFDGMTIVIDVPEFDPCPDLDFSLRLSDLGLDPHLYFPIGGGAFTFGIVTVLGVLGVEANLDPGIGIALEDCNFGPAQIRISPLSQEATVSGMLSVTTTSMVQLGADLGLRADVTAIIAIPSAPPIVLVVPVMGVALGGAMEFMLQSRATISSAMTATMGIGGISAAYNIGAEVGYGLDLSYGLYGSLSILGLDLCRVGWPVDRIHKELGVNLNLAAALSLGTGGFDFSYAFSATPITANPLEDLNFAFDDSRLDDECWLCEFMQDNGLLPGQNGYNWANPTYQASLPRLGGPRGDIMARQPDPSKDAKCRGTCGVDCAEQSCDKEQYDLIRCENVADHHIWHTYVNYATCGAHQGCMDHDACYDMAADMPVWGFGGMMIGPMFRACDLGAMCGYSFQQGVTWAMGGGPYDRRLAYADERRVKRGCLGACPENVAPEGEAEIQQTCLDDRELWQGTEVGDQWGFDFGRVNLFQGFVTVPWIVGVHYGVDAKARIDADASAQLGPINLENACLIYDPDTMTYTGTADLSLFLNGRASASITAALDGWLSDFLCLFNVIDLRGTLNAGATVQFPTFLTAGVDLYCADGNLEIRPKASIEACLDIFGEIRAALDVFVLSFNVWGQEWPLIQKQIEKCWKMQISFEPFIVGQAPRFDLLSSGLDYFGLVTDLFEPARHVEIDRTPARNPLPGARLLFPCIGDDDGDDDADTPPDCSNKATVAQALAHTSVADRTPRWGSTDTITIPDGSAAEAGTSMEVKYLTSDLDGGSPPSVQAAIYRRVGLPTSGCLNKGYKAHHEFIRGHLLNENVGGPGDQENNLFPITGKANRDHKTQVEQGGLNVVGKVGQGDVVYYKVTIQGASSPRPIAHPTTGVTEGFYEISSTLHCEVADYNFCNDNSFHRNPLRTVDVPSQFVFGTGGDAFDTKVKHPYCSR